MIPAAQRGFSYFGANMSKVIWRVYMRSSNRYFSNAFRRLIIAANTAEVAARQGIKAAKNDGLACPYVVRLKMIGTVDN